VIVSTSEQGEFAKRFFPSSSKTRFRLRDPDKDRGALGFLAAWST